MTTPQPSPPSEQTVEEFATRHLPEDWDGGPTWRSIVSALETRDAAQQAKGRQEALKEIAKDLWQYAILLREMGNTNAADHMAGKAERLDPSLIRKLSESKPGKER